MDAVITWVDGSDPAHAALRARYGGPEASPAATDLTRFANSGELRFAVRSLLKFCPYIGRIHVVTAGQHPHPIDAELSDPATAGRIAVVDHAAIFGEHADLLPTFSSRSIEFMLHRIPDLAEQFLYLNDDFSVGRATPLSTYFEGGRPRLRGRLRRFPNPVVARIRRLLRPPRPGFVAAQRDAARLLGHRDRFLQVEHQPHPMRVSTLRDFFADRPDLLRDQVRHRFRSSEQVSPIGLSHHLELAAGATVDPPGDIGYLRPGRPASAGLPAVLDQLAAGAFECFCVQSLDQFEAEDRALILRRLAAHVT